MAINVDPGSSSLRDQVDVKIVWKGRRIAKLIFPSGKIVEFDESVGPAKLRVIDGSPAQDETSPSTNSPRFTDPSHER